MSLMMFKPSAIVLYRSALMEILRYSEESEDAGDFVLWVGDYIKNVLEDAETAS